MERKEQMERLRDQGLKYREIAEMFGVSKQYVAKVCGKQNTAHFKPIGGECVYPNLRKWLNENQVTRAEFLRRMGFIVHASNYTRLCKIISGEWPPRKDYIDKMLEVTGLTYETLFEVLPNGG